MYKPLERLQALKLQDGILLEYLAIGNLTPVNTYAPQTHSKRASQTPILQLDAGDDYAGDITTLGIMPLDGTHISGAIETSGDRDWFAFTVNDFDTILFTIEATSLPGSEFLEIRDSEGHIVSFEDISRGSDFVLQGFNTGGTYYLDMSAGGFADTGSYTLSAVITPDEYGTGITTTGILNPGDTFSSIIGGNDDEDWVQISLVADQQINILNNGNSSHIFSIYDSTGQLITQNYDEDAFYFTPDVTGDYYFAVSTELEEIGNFSYILHEVSITDDYANDTSTTGIIANGDTVTGNIGTDDAGDWFAITLSAGEFLEISFAASNIEPRVTFYDSNGDKIYAYGTGSIFSQSLKLSILPVFTDGLYYVSVRGTADTPYTINADVFTDDFSAHPLSEPPESTATPGLVTLDGPSVNGNLERYDDDDWFAIDLVAGQGVSVFATIDGDHTSPLTLHVSAPTGTSGASLTYNENSAYGTIAAHETGTYYISVQSNTNFRGEYTLTTTSLPDDFSQDASTSGVVNLNNITVGSLDYNHDIDAFAFTVQAGGVIRFDLFSPEGIASLRLTITDAEGNIIEPGFSLFQGTTDMYRFSESGTYYANMQGSLDDRTTPVEYFFFAIEIPDFQPSQAMLAMFTDTSILWTAIREIGPTPTVPTTGLAFNLDIIDEEDENGNFELVDYTYYEVADGDTIFSDDGGALFLSESSGTLDNYGTIWSQSTHYAYGASAISGVNWGIVSNYGTIAALAVANSFSVRFGSGGILHNYGDIYAMSNTGYAIAYQNYQSGAPNIDSPEINTGRIEAWSNEGGADAVRLIGEAYFINSGEVLATGYHTSNGLVMGFNGTVENSGLIEARTGSLDYSFGIRVGGNLTLINTGIISADIAILAEGGINTISNDGTIIGEIILYNGNDALGVDDTFINTGEVYGSVDMGAYIDFFDGTKGVIYGALYMGAGDDTALTGQSNDVIFGQSGNDIIKAGAGNDRLYGGTGDDELYGEAGADTYIMGRNAGNDQIFGYQAGVDRIEFTGDIHSFEQLKIFQDGNNVIIASIDGIITLVDMDISALNPADFHFQISSYEVAPSPSDSFEVENTSESQTTKFHDETFTSETLDSPELLVALDNITSHAQIIAPHLNETIFLEAMFFDDGFLA